MIILDAISPSVQTGQVLVDFGFHNGLEGDVASVTVQAPWITANTLILCNPASVSTVDHDPDDIAVECLDAYAQQIIPGQSFVVIASAPHNTWGKYYINYMGVCQCQ